jgi:thymidylate synthase
MNDLDLNPGPRFFPYNKEDPMYGMDSIIRALVHDPKSIGAEVRTIQRNNAICTGVKQNIFVFDGNGPVPVSSLRKVYLTTGVKEFICYMRGYTNIKQFQALGVKTWDKDYHENLSWQKNPNNKGDGDIGEIYFAHARNLIGPNGEAKDLLAEQIQLLREGNYNRRNIINYFDPFTRGALPACLYEHAFTVHNGYLNLSSTQRSCDSSLGGSFNAATCYFFLKFMCAMTGLKCGWITYTVHDLHIYQSQIESIKEYIDNKPYPATAQLTIGEKINTSTTLEEFEAMDVKDIFTISGYQSHGEYKVPLTV